MIRDHRKLNTCVVLICLLFSSPLFSQKARNMLMNLPSKTTPGRFFSKMIVVYPYYFNDTMSDGQLLSSYPYLAAVKKGTPYYVLNDKDSLRIAVSIVVKGAKYVVTRYEPNGTVTQIGQYDMERKADGTYMEYFPDKKCKVYGKSKKGKGIGRWDYYDERGYAIYTETYEEGKMNPKTEIFKEPVESKFPFKHLAPVPLNYTLSKYVAPVRRK
jgi:antitoxin component YwqK of YwqJK toxin-antitoxin module